jgi:hypothetical protein
MGESGDRDGLPGSDVATRMKATSSEPNYCWHPPQK